MAGGMDLGTSTKGAKKPLDATINLVPFIDLMAVTISFLIMTAVWTQIGRLQVASAGGPSSDEQQQDQKTVPVVLLITEKELKLTVGGSVSDPIPVTRDAKGKIDLSKLKDKFKEVRTQLPDQQQITLQTEDSVRYEDLVHIIDECDRRRPPGDPGLSRFDLKETSMAIKVPGKRFGKRLEHSKVFGEHGGVHKMAKAADLNITPMVDMFIIIVLFLIANFSATGDILNMSKDIVLPEAAHVQELQLVPVVMVSMEEVVIDGTVIGRVDDLTREDYLNIPALEEKLRDMKKKFEDLHNAAGEHRRLQGRREHPGAQGSAVQDHQAGDVQLPVGRLQQHQLRHAQLGQPERAQDGAGEQLATATRRADETARATPGPFLFGRRLC